MRSVDLFRFAGGSLLRHGLRSALSLLGVTIGVTAVVVLVALGESARRYVMDQFASIGNNLLIVIPGKTETAGAFPGMGGAANDLTLADAAAVERQVRGAAGVAAMSAGTETVESGDRRRQVAVIGATANFLRIRRLELSRGEFLPTDEAERGRSAAVIGTRVAKELFPGEDPIGQVIRIGSWRFRVIGIVAPMGTQLGLDIDEIVLVPVATGLKMFNRSSLFRLIVEVAPGADPAETERQLVRVLAERHGEEDVTVLSQDSVVSAASGILRALTLAIGAIAAISLAVAGIGILNVMLVSVTERTGEIGLLRALGAGRKQVQAVFLIEAALLSSAGGLVGLAAGAGLTGVVGRIFPALAGPPPAWAAAAALLTALGTGITFGLLPARRAARLDPVEALRTSK